MAKKIDNPIAALSFDKASFQSGIYEVQRFSALIRHECCRADRSGKTFTLVAFALGEKPASPARIKAVSTRLIKAMRSIDEVGWLEDGRIGVLLPATTLEGAHQYARRASAEDRDLSYTVFIYPDHWMRDFGVCEDVTDKSGSRELDIADSCRIEMPAWKRGLDIIGSSLGILILWPLFLIVALYIKIVSPGPAFFRQKRVGQGGKLFTFVKFRTMKCGNDQAAHQDHIIRRIRAGEILAKLDDKDPRIIPGGRLLRKSCVDELPQLFNVLRGEMSLVGPRPCVPYEAREFLIWHTHRFDAMPGMTGLWQVSGKNKLTFAQMIRLDISYASDLSLANDLIIIARTVPTVAGLILESIAKRLRKAEGMEEKMPGLEEGLNKRAAL